MSTRILKHPSFESVTLSVPEEDVAEWEQQGWLPLLTPEQQERFEQLEAEATAPPANGSRAQWAAYAKTKGATDELLEDMTRDDIRVAYGN